MPENLAILNAANTQNSKQQVMYNEEAEQALLGTLLYNNASYEQVSDFLKKEHFCHPVNGKVFSAISILLEKGQIADAITLKDYFLSQKELSDIGGVEYLAQLTISVVSIVNTREYGKIIHDLYLRRQLVKIACDLSNNAKNIDLERQATDCIENTEQQLFELSTSSTVDRDFITFTEALATSVESAQKAFKMDGNVVGVTTGLIDMDKKLGGLHPSDLIILAARPSMGKTALATSIAFNAAKAQLKDKQSGAVVAFFSLEMSAEQIATRILSSESAVTADKIRKGILDAYDFEKFMDVSKQLASIPLYIDDTPALSIAALRTRCRRLKRKQKLGLIVIDYLQLVTTHGLRNYENRVQELSLITRSLKALAKELNVPVLALSQLSRAVEQREDKRPQLSDLRESGSIEQDADVVMFIYRAAYYLERKEPEMNTPKHEEWRAKMDSILNVSEIFFAKQRHGPIGNIKLYYNNKLVKFGDLLDTKE